MKFIYTSVWLIGTIIVTILSSCIRESFDDCFVEVDKGDIDISFYSKSPCQSDSLYPRQVNDLTIGVFDEKGVMVTHLLHSNVVLSRFYYTTVNIKHGVYTVAAWSGIDESFTINELQNGTTKKSDILFQLKRSGDVASEIRKHVYFGEVPATHINLSNTKSTSTRIAVNLLEMTNRLTISIEGLSDNAEDYEIDIEANNGTMNFDGSIAADEVVKYESTTSVENGTLAAKFSLLRLDTGHKNTIVIKNKKSGTELYRGSLLGTLLLKNPEINLDCDHDFTIRFTAEDQCSCGDFMIIKIWVNDWLVHTYDKEM